MSHPFPHHYTLETRSLGGQRSLISAGQRPALEGGPPPEFDGNETDWSPEHLLLASLASCYLATFPVLAKRAGLEYSQLELSVDATLDRSPDGLRFSSIRLAPRLRVGPADEARAREQLVAAKKSCLIGRALSAPIELVLEAALV